MRSFYITAALAVICNCAGKNTNTDSAVVTRRPELYYNLRYPIYLVVDESFYFGCEQSPTDEAACRALRLQHIKEGVNEWLDYFDDANRPKVVFFPSTEKPPSDSANKTILVRMQSVICGRAALACWFERKDPPEIVFANRRWIIPRIMAHEFGHVLGRGDNDVPAGTVSIMSYNTQKAVEPLDIKMVCKLHRECKMEKLKLK